MNLLTPFIFLTIIQFSISSPLQRIDCETLKYTHCLSNPKLILECNKQELCLNTTQLVSVPNLCLFCQLVAMEAIEYFNQENEEEGELEQEFCDSSNSTCLNIVDRIYEFVDSFSSNNLPSYSEVCKALGMCENNKDSANRIPDLYIDIDIDISEEQIEYIQNRDIWKLLESLPKEGQIHFKIKYFSDKGQKINKVFEIIKSYYISQT